jgi:formamidopyrimidine-DNA glycosylase
MPELPEVETVVRGLASRLTDKRVRAVSRVSPHLLAREPKLRSLRGEVFDSFSRRGKYIIATLRSGRHLLIHLRMSGRLQVKPKRSSLDRHDHLVLSLADCSEKLVFRDVRKFGQVEIHNGDCRDRLLSLGPEADRITVSKLLAVCNRSSRPLKNLLLDQTKLAGLGNIYLDESLHRAGIHPRLPADRLTPQAANLLVNSIRVILRKAIKCMGTTVDSYRAADGQTGRFAGYLKVYNNEGNRCHCGRADVIKIRLGGRGTHFCPNCQKLPAGRLVRK